MKKAKMNQRQKALLAVCRKYEISCHQLNNDLKVVRAELENEPFYEKPVQNKKIPIMPNTEKLKLFFAAFDQMNDPQYKLWARLIYDTGLRVHEMVNILLNEIDFEKKTILIHGKGSNGKGKKDRVVLFSSQVAELLKLHIYNANNRIFLFEKEDSSRYTTRRVQQVFYDARKIAGIEFRMSPHIGRHVALTNLTENGWDNPITRLQSGHESDASLNIYQHLGIGRFQKQFDTVRQNFWAGVM